MNFYRFPFKKRPTPSFQPAFRLLQRPGVPLERQEPAIEPAQQLLCPALPRATHHGDTEAAQKGAVVHLLHMSSTSALPFSMPCIWRIKRIS